MQDELGITILSNTIFISCSYALFVLNLTNSVLDEFKNNKLLLNHNFNLLRTSVTLCRKTRGSGLHMITLVSSAKRIGKD
jgi:hypothetical protein